MDYRIGLIDSNELVRSGRAMIFNAQPTMKVVFEESEPGLAIERAPDYLVDVLVVGPSQHRMRGDQFIKLLCAALAKAKNDCAVIAYNAFSDERLRFAALQAGAQEFVGLDESAERFIDLVRQVTKKDHLVDVAILSELVSKFGPLDSNARLEVQLASLSEQQTKMVALFVAGTKDQDIAKEFDSARTRVTQLIDGLVVAAGFTSRNQLCMYLLGALK